MPFTSCTCERSASSLWIIKTYLRSTMSQERLNSLASLYTQKDIKVEADSVVNRYALRHSRRLQLGNILNSDTVGTNDEIRTSEVY